MEESFSCLLRAVAGTTRFKGMESATTGHPNCTNIPFPAPLLTISYSAMSIMDSYHKKTADMACPFALSSSSQTTAPDWLWRPLFICEANILFQVQSTKKDKKNDWSEGCALCRRCCFGPQQINMLKPSQHPQIFEHC